MMGKGGRLVGFGFGEVQFAPKPKLEAKNPEPAPPLPDKFRAESHGSNWHLFCLKCDEGWSLPKSSSPHPGNILHLLNHYASHKSGGRETT